MKVELDKVEFAPNFKLIANDKYLSRKNIIFPLIIQVLEQNIAAKIVSVARI